MRTSQGGRSPYSRHEHMLFSTTHRTCQSGRAHPGTSHHRYIPGFNWEKQQVDSLCFLMAARDLLKTDIIWARLLQDKEHIIQKSETYSPTLLGEGRAGTDSACWHSQL